MTSGPLLLATLGSVGVLLARAALLCKALLLAIALLLLPIAHLSQVAALLCRMLLGLGPRRGGPSLCLLSISILLLTIALLLAVALLLAIGWCLDKLGTWNKLWSI